LVLRLKEIALKVLYERDGGECTLKDRTGLCWGMVRPVMQTSVEIFRLEVAVRKPAISITAEMTWILVTSTDFQTLFLYRWHGNHNRTLTARKGIIEDERGEYMDSVMNCNCFQFSIYKISNNEDPQIAPNHLLLLIILRRNYQL